VTAAELIKLRQRLHWSQAAAAKQLGCSTRSIVNWEKGATKIPTNIALAASAVLLGLPPYGSK
jgi:DNA-binding XRE family transcriptional regulator